MDEQRNDSLSIEQCVHESTKYTQGLISFYIRVFSKALAKLKTLVDGLTQ